MGGYDAVAGGIEAFSAIVAAPVFVSDSLGNKTVTDLEGVVSRGIPFGLQHGSSLVLLPQSFAF